MINVVLLVTGWGCLVCSYSYKCEYKYAAMAEGKDSKEDNSSTNTVVRAVLFVVVVLALADVPTSVIE